MRLLPLRFGRVRSVHLLVTGEETSVQLFVLKHQPYVKHQFPAFDPKSLGHYYYTMNSLKARQSA